MMIYIDNECKCHISDPDGTFREIETDFFDGKCPEFIQGFRFVPEGECYSREDGQVFAGNCIVPWKDTEALEAFQHRYEQAQIADMQTALNKLGVILDA